ncbi:hypothetical protein [Sporomusa sp.]|uniref:hypothetical protein n=1 Tax=Sporomusa sp. TaxID=2078658 RepID=UPI002CDEC98D|nr:hypothetical protein [Sporomusa sp.]HWR07776.1 hypothetical protein [Sporomusa sp.]
MIIRVEKRENPYAQIDKACLNDTCLSWKAKGLLSYLLSKPDNWQPMPNELAKASTDGIDSVKKGLNELEEASYLVRRKVRDQNTGKIIAWERVVFEVPQVDLPLEEKPLMENPLVAEPLVVNPTLIINKLNNKELKENELNNNVASATHCDISAEKPVKGGAQGDEGKPGSLGNDGAVYSAEFEDFWRHYPKRREKRKAWRCWKLCLKAKVAPTDLILAAEKYAIQCKGKSQEFIKLPATFLGPDKPYEDYLKPEDEAPVPDSVLYCEKCGGKGVISMVTDAGNGPQAISYPCDCTKKAPDWAKKFI